MLIFIILLIAACAGLIVIGFIWYNELLVGKKVSKKLAQEEKLSKKLGDENERLRLQVEVLNKSNVELKDALHVKKEDLLKGDPAVRRHIAEYIDRTKLKDIMSAKVVAIRYSEPFSEVARKMKEHNIRHLPVIDQDNRLVGLITQRMLYKIKSPRKLMDGEWYYDEDMLNDVILEHVMIKDVVSLKPEDSIGVALIKMTNSRYGSIPITDESKTLLGIVTRKDILKTAAAIYEKELGHGT